MRNGAGDLDMGGEVRRRCRVSCYLEGDGDVLWRRWRLLKISRKLLCGLVCNVMML